MSTSGIAARFAEMSKAGDQPINKLGTVVEGLSALALFIIACVAAAGAMPSAAAGWTMVGLGGGTILGNLMKGRIKERLPVLVATSAAAIVAVVLGILGGVGTLGAVQLGAGMLGTYGSLTGLVCLIGCVGGSIAGRKIAHNYGEMEY